MNLFIRFFFLKNKFINLFISFLLFRSVTLLLQISLPCILFGSDKSYITLKGGTNVDFAPSIDYTINVFKPMLQKFGADFNCDIVKR